MTMLILIGGLAGAGKTTLGREMARLTKFAFLDKDTVTQPLVEALLSAIDAPGGRDDRQSSAYLNLVRPAEYQAFLNVVVENVSLGVSTIAVAPFIREMADQAWLDELQKRVSNARLHGLWLAPPDHLLHEQLRSRNSARDRHKLANWAEHVILSRSIKPCAACRVVGPQPGQDPREFAFHVLTLIGVDSQMQSM